MYQFEICANSVESCIAAQKGGANRVELCAGIPEGGTTPSYGEIKMARKLLDIRLHVIIRPRGGDFLYSPLEVEIMEQDILFARQTGVDGVVFGCLTPNGDIDLVLMERLVKAAKGLSVTFHRAFDHCKEPFTALEQLIELGCNRILTSGQQPTAEQGIPLLKELVRKADGRVIILPGSGINKNNIGRIAESTGAKEFHFSARGEMTSKMIYKRQDIPMNSITGMDDYTFNNTTSIQVKEIIAALQSAN